MTKKNLLLVAYDGLGNSGVPIVMKYIVDFASADYNIDVIYFEDINFYLDYFLQKCENVRLIKLPLFKSKIGKGVWHFFKKRRFLYKLFLKEIFKTKTYHIVHSFKEYDSGPIFKAAKKCGVKTRILHCNVIHETPNSILQRILYKIDRKQTLSYATKLIGVSKKCCEYAFKKKTYFLVHNPYDEKIFQRIDSSLQKNDLVLLQVANFCSNKNQILSIQVLYNLIKMNNQARLVFVGREIEEGYLKLMNKKIEELKISNHISFLPHNTKPDNYLPLTSYYIIPSLREGASIVAIEAQAAGKHVFASSSLSEDMNVGGCTFIKSDADAEIWAKTIFEHFLKNNNFLEECNMKDFSIESFNGNIKKIYESSND